MIDHHKQALVTGNNGGTHHARSEKQDLVNVLDRQKKMKLSDRELLLAGDEESRLVLLEAEGRSNNTEVKRMVEGTPHLVNTTDGVGSKTPTPADFDGEIEVGDAAVKTLDIERKVKKRKPRLAAILIALCCHSRCTWPTFAGRDFFSNVLGFDAVDFHILSRMTSWAVCGSRMEPTRPNRLEVGLEPDGRETASVTVTRDDGTNKSESCIPCTDEKLPPCTGGRGYVPHQREAVGLKCKRLIDRARVEYLRERGFKGRLVHFVNPLTSLENVLLIATPC